jgi:DEAD/DEAH box helicase domain-containing protein
MADIRDIDTCIGDKSGEYFLSSGRNGRALTSASLQGTERPEDRAVLRLDDFDPTVFLFDAYPGGIGFSELLYEEHDRLLAAARQLIRGCPCTHGCPSCVGPTLEVGPAGKEAALAILKNISPEAPLH